jgi:fatty aldehyde-generating acyl-ACP reductase
MERFSLIVHPLSLQDFGRKFPQARYLPDFILRRVARFWPPFQISVIKGIRSSFAEVEGEIRCCPLTAAQFLSLPAAVTQRKIISAVKSAEKGGAKIVGLGAWTAVIGEGGTAIAREVGIPVTTGNSYTIFCALEETKKAARVRGINWERANLVILGATGLKDSAGTCARLLARKNRFVTLAVREQANYADLDKLTAEILYETGVAVRITNNLKKVLREADVVIAFTTATDFFAEIEPGDLPRGGVVCDVLWPRKLAQKVMQKRRDILVMGEGVVEVPGRPECPLCPAWMAEVLILALEKRYEAYSLGNNIGIGQVEEIGRLAHKHGFKSAGFQGLEDCWQVFA